eukprot:TRINITY_DN20631_c0_g1_i1.p3 TRINITY_DN20631_c0_g1~~TRINITY_DN20631_c0_g1_i1.p3  ORF type:complete len:155 (-),score=28.43 TRINITY_DN20631_c0_g1_i1:53-517(-)
MARVCVGAVAALLLLVVCGGAVPPPNTKGTPPLSVIPTECPPGQVSVCVYGGGAKGWETLCQPLWEARKTLVASTGRNSYLGECCSKGRSAYCELQFGGGPEPLFGNLNLRAHCLTAEEADREGRKLAGPEANKKILVKGGCRLAVPDARYPMP